MDLNDIFAGRMVMRQLFAVLLMGLAGASMSGAEGGATKVEVKGPHICCTQCVNVVADILGKVEGVSDVKSNTKTKTVNFTAKDDKAAQAGFKALLDGGFFGTATADGKEIKNGLPATAKGGSVESITVKDVHVCCGACRTAVNKAFKDAKVSYAGKGPQLTVTIAGTALEQSAVLETLRKAGFNGKLDK